MHINKRWKNQKKSEKEIMNILVLKYLILILINSAQSVPVKEKMPFKPKMNPPGTVWLRDSLFIDVAPVKNVDYKEFESFVQIAYSKELRDSLKNIPSYGIDMNCFQSYMRLCGPDKQMAAKMKVPVNAPLSWAMNMNEYYNSPHFRHYPVLHISFIQAQAFCEWRTDMVMLLFAVSSKNEKQRTKYYTRVRYRMPTIEEWEYAMEKFKENVYTNMAVYAGERCATIEAVPQKKNLEFVYIPHNIAEMTTTEKTAVGLSWRDADTTDNYSKTVSYAGPRDWLGFRCVCEIVEY